jgi:hypothetical protein
MYKSASRGEQFLDRSGSESTKGSRKGFGLLGGGEKETLTPDQERAVLVAAIAALEGKIKDLKSIDRRSMPLRRREELNAEIKALGIKKFDLQRKVTELLPLLREWSQFEDLGSFIIEVMKERLTKPEWRALVSEAKRRYDLQGGGNAA